MICPKWLKLLYGIFFDNNKYVKQYFNTKERLKED